MAIALVASTSLFLLQPFFYKRALDVIATSAAGDDVAWMQASFSILMGVGVAIAALAIEQAAATLLGFIEVRVMREMHRDVFAKVQRLSTDFHVNEFAGATARKISRGTEAAENMLDRIWFNFLPTAAIAIGLMVVLVSYAPILGIVMVTGIVLTILLGWFLNGILSRAQSWADEQDTRVTANLVDTLTGNALVKSFAAETREDGRHDASLLEWRHRLQRLFLLSPATTMLQFLLLMMLEASVLLLAIWLWHEGRFSPGDFVVAFLYMTHLWGRLWDVGKNIRDYRKSVAHCEEMVELAERPLMVEDRSDASVLTVAKGDIAFESVTFRYESQNESVFEDFSVRIRPGEKIALVGHSGGGKSTFVKLLMRLYDVQAGRIAIDSQDISGVTQESLREALGLVAQDPILFHRTIRENIAYGTLSATDEQVVAAAKQAHAHEFISSLPRGYETLVGERGVKLSGGERQRVAIARAFLADRPILILDEATSSLDSLSEKYIQESLSQLMEGRTTIVIAHRLSTIKRVDRILVIEDGSIVEQGTHTELVSKEGGVYRHLYELQAGGFIGE
jgi:ATP-binding cassette subfamily B protein